MATVDDVAQWMKSELENTNWLYQETVVYKIKELFGDTFVYLNANGNLSIDKKVLATFRKLTNDTVIWDRGEKAWRKRTPCPGPALPGLPDHSFPVTDVKRETVPARMRPIEKSSLHQVRSRCWRQ